MSSEIIVKNVNSYARQLQLYQTYSFIDLPSKGTKKLSNVSDEAIKYYEKCDFVVEKVSTGMQVLNEVPEELGKKGLKNLNEIGIGDSIEMEVRGVKEIKDLKEEGIGANLLQSKLSNYDSEMLRALLVDIGVNPKNLQNKEKLIELLLEQDQQDIMKIIDSE